MPEDMGRNALHAAGFFGGFFQAIGNGMISGMPSIGSSHFAGWEKPVKRQSPKTLATQLPHEGFIGMRADDSPRAILLPLQTDRGNVGHQPVHDESRQLDGAGLPAFVLAECDQSALGTEILES